jgi:steroid delta-isomerase-like uncharacterized protein
MRRPIAVLLAFVLLGCPASRLGAQEGTPAGDASDLPRILVDFGTAWSSGDPEQVVAIYTADAVFQEFVLGGAVTRSHDELRAYAAVVFAAFPDFTATPTAGFVAGDRAVVEWVLTGTYTGQFGDLPPGTGQPIEIPVASILWLDGELIGRDNEYWDVAMLLAQVGVLPG